MKGFFESVYEIVKSIPEGKVITYGDIAFLLGNKKLARQVGYALHVNPDPENIPCYRVVNRFGQVSSSFAFGGGEEQKRRLRKEGVEFDEKGCVKPCFFVKINV